MIRQLVESFANVYLNRALLALYACRLMQTDGDTSH